jgi:hypothetical protein
MGQKSTERLYLCQGLFKGAISVPQLFFSLLQFQKYCEKSLAGKGARYLLKSCLGFFTFYRNPKP